MSTTARIGVVEGDNIKSVHVMSDGYPNWTGEKLIENWNSKELADSLISYGDIRCLFRSLENTQFVDFVNQSNFKKRAKEVELADLELVLDESHDYLYIWVEKVGWMWCENTSYNELIYTAQVMDSDEFYRANLSTLTQDDCRDKVCKHSIHTIKTQDFIRNVQKNIKDEYGVELTQFEIDAVIMGLNNWHVDTDAMLESVGCTDVDSYQETWEDDPSDVKPTNDSGDPLPFRAGTKTTKIVIDKDGNIVK